MPIFTVFFIFLGAKLLYELIWPITKQNSFVQVTKKEIVFGTSLNVIVFNLELNHFMFDRIVHVLY